MASYYPSNLEAAAASGDEDADEEETPDADPAAQIGVVADVATDASLADAAALISDAKTNGRMSRTPKISRGCSARIYGSSRSWISESKSSKKCATSVTTR